MRKLKYNLFFIIPLLLFTGCLTPYHENFTCNKGVNTGACSSVSENYKISFLEQDRLPLTKKQKEIFLEDLKNDEVIESHFFGLYYTIEDEEYLINLPENKFKYFIAVFKKDLNDNSLKILKQIEQIRQRNTIPFIDRDFNYIEDISNSQYIKNEKLRQKIELMQSKTIKRIDND